MKLRIACLAMCVTFAAFSFAQSSAKQKRPSPGATDIDPLALQVLKAVTDPIHQSKTFSFRVLVSQEALGTNDQIITVFHLTDVTVERPDKLHLTFKRPGREVELFYNAGQAVLYSPQQKLYTSFSAANTIDRALDNLDKQDIFIPTRNFLESDPYQSLKDGLKTGYVVGRVNLFDQTVHQLAFTEPQAEWQMWVIGGDKPRILRVQIVDKSKPYKPHTTLEFADWNFSPQVRPGTFSFTKPVDAKEIQMLNAVVEK